MSEVLRRKLARAEERVAVLEAMIEDRTRDLYLANEDLTNEVERRRRSEMRQRRFRDVLDRARDSIFVIDPSTAAIVEANRGACDRLGYSMDELLELSVADFEENFPGLDAWANHVEHVRRTGSTMLEGVHVARDQSRFPVEVNVAFVEMGEDSFVLAIARDVTARKAVEKRLREAQRELVDASRLAGMAEIATGVLHNIGNVINSVNVSTDQIRRCVDRSRSKSLRRISDLLETHRDALASFLTEDRVGQRLSEFIGAVAEQLDADSNSTRAELDSLQEHLAHVRAIIATQQSMAKGGGVVETVALDTVIHDAVCMRRAELNASNVEVVEDYEILEPIQVDRHKLMQILVNLISNAADALEASGRENRRLRTRLHCSDGQWIKLIVEDNGVGIEPAHLDQIFQHGFTTKQEGHGFGLHTSAISANELGGELRCASLGLNEGARFTLTLPVGG